MHSEFVYSKVNYIIKFDLTTIRRYSPNMGTHLELN